VWSLRITRAYCLYSICQSLALATSHKEIGIIVCIKHFLFSIVLFPTKYILFYLVFVVVTILPCLWQSYFLTAESGFQCLFFHTGFVFICIVLNVHLTILVLSSNQRQCQMQGGWMKLDLGWTLIKVLRSSFCVTFEHFE